MSRELSSIKATQEYGPKKTNLGLPNTVSTYGVVRQAEVYFDFEEVNAGLPTFNADDDSAVTVLPANTFLKSATLYVDTAFTSAGSATLELGFQQKDGTVIDADGIDSIAVASLTADSWTVNDGALVGASIGALDAQISIDDATAVFTAGTGRLVLEYYLPFASP